MKYLALLKKEENAYQDPLPKLPEPPFDSFDSEGGRHIRGKRDPEPVDYDAEITAVIHEFDEAGIIVPEVPVEIRREALALEDEITEACNEHDVVRFRQALHSWRLAWLRSLH